MIIVIYLYCEKIKSMKLLSIIAVLSSLILFSCGDSETIDLPVCIDTKLQAFMDEDCITDLTIWRFRGQDVYCFNYASCPNQASFADILDAECNLLCTLGGPDANSICDGTDWTTNASLTTTVFEN